MGTDAGTGVERRAAGQEGGEVGFTVLSQVLLSIQRRNRCVQAGITLP